MTARARDLRRPIDKDRILIVEGMDEFSLTIWLLEHMGIPRIIDIRPPYQDVAPLDVYLTDVVLSTPGFGDVRAVGVMRDAEDLAATDALQSVSRAFATAFPSAPALRRSGALETAQFRGRSIQIGAFITPDGQNPGMLEDLCVASIPRAEPERDVTECVGQYVQCLAAKGVARPDWAKRRAQAYLAACEKPGLKVGEAAQAGYWDFSHDCWLPLKQFLHALAGE
jgi:hypothetical protein